MRWDGLRLINMPCPRVNSQEHKARTGHDFFTINYVFQIGVGFWGPRWHSPSLDLLSAGSDVLSHVCLWWGWGSYSNFINLRLVRSAHHNVPPVPCPGIQVTAVVHRPLRVHFIQGRRPSWSCSFLPFPPHLRFLGSPFRAGNEIITLYSYSKFFLHCWLKYLFF